MFGKDARETSIAASLMARIKREKLEINCIPFANNSTIYKIKRRENTWSTQLAAC
jgi:hypothetical protein